LKIEIHDSDEMKKLEDDKFNYGVAKFTLKDMLNPFCKNLKLWSDVYPVKRALLNTENELNLNATAWKLERTTEKASPYFESETYITIESELAFPLGTFNEEHER